MVVLSSTGNCEFNPIDDYVRYGGPAARSVSSWNPLRTAAIG